MNEERHSWPMSGSRARNGDQEAVDARERLSDSTFQQRSRPKVVLGIRDLVFHQEVLDYLERDPRLDVVAAVRWPGALVQAMRDLAHHMIVACPAMVREMRHPAVVPSSQLMVVAEEMTVPILRAAIDVGARGVFAWPEERAELAAEISSTGDHSREVIQARGRVIAVCGTRGGSGTTFVATHLAASFADRGRRCVLVDLDSAFADVTIALGIDPQSRTIADLIPVLGELGPDHLEDALYCHPRGFSVLLAPSEPNPLIPLPPGLYPGAIALLAGAFEVVVLHVPRGLNGLVRAVVTIADDVVVVVAPDLFSLHAARRALQGFGLDDRRDRCRLVLNPALRNQVGRREVERVLGMAPFGAVRFDPAVVRVQARSRLLPPRGRRAAKDVRILADKLCPPDAALARLPSSDRERS
ncbi:MAG TPA: AAA family ATPase [Actinomycetota bacterium]|nr:AAA family ATPase [Actinomycetota bacterium]